MVNYYIIEGIKFHWYPERESRKATVHIYMSHEANIVEYNIMENSYKRLLNRK